MKESYKTDWGPALRRWFVMGLVSFTVGRLTSFVMVAAFGP